MEEKRNKKVKAFYKVFVEFLNDLIIIQPNDSSLLWVQVAISLVSEETLVQQFMNYIEPYKKKILERNETFFLNELHKEFHEESFMSKEINKIKEIWNDPLTSNSTKEDIWKYMIILIKLGSSLNK